MDQEEKDLKADELKQAAQPEDEPGNPGPAAAEDTLKAAEEKARDYLSKWQRAQADFINYKRRVEQERSDFARQAGAEIILSILPALDDLDRAVEAVPEDIKGHSWVDGIRHIDRKLRSALESHGLERIESVGENFDPNIHESAALAYGKEDMVVNEIKAGYKLFDRVIRPCTVIVGSGEEAPCPANEQNKIKKSTKKY
ncbi:MAG: nucleotide exchange factor GrpE [Dehalococcoidaceae bacterium]|nr:nucleotide exchange factor GrpE [Dehalococcoidaceae bacterium]